MCTVYTAHHTVEYVKGRHGLVMEIGYDKHALSGIHGENERTTNENSGKEKEDGRKKSIPFAVHSVHTGIRRRCTRQWTQKPNKRHIYREVAPFMTLITKIGLFSTLHLIWSVAWGCLRIRIWLICTASLQLFTAFFETEYVKYDNFRGIK